VADFFEHLLGELKSGRLTREAALALLADRGARRASAPEGNPARLRGEPLLTTETWHPVDLRPGQARDVRRIVCVVDARSEGVIARAFAAAAPGIEATLLPIAGLDADRGDEIDFAGTRAAIATAFAALGERQGRVDALVHLPTPSGPATCASIETALALLQGLHDAGFAWSRLLLCAGHADAPSRSHAEALIAIERTLRVIAPDKAATVMVSETLPDDAAALETHVARIVAELGTPHPGSCRYRAGRRHGLRSKPAAAMTRSMRLRQGGTYLITGGLGALGRIFAAHLAQAFRANLVLIGRGEPDAAAAGMLDRLRADGIQVVHERLDVADVDALRACTERARARFGGLHGVIHAAGVEGRGLLFDNDIDRMRRVLRPKVAGTLALEDALRDCPELDFICCFSSNSAVLGDFGSFDYAIANRFQMAHAQHGADPSGPLRLAIGWPFWEAGGMGSDSDAERTRLYLESSGQQPLEPRLGVKLFELMMRGDGGFCLAMYGDLPKLRALLASIESGRIPAPPSEPQSAAPKARARAALRGLDIARCVELELGEQIGELLKLSPERILPRQNLADYGFDSIQMSRWARQISRHYGIEITPAVFFSHPSLSRVVEYLLEHHGDRLRAFYAEAESIDAAASAQRVPRTAESSPVAGASGSPDRTPASAETGSGAGAGAGAISGTATVSAAARSEARDEAIAIVGISGRFPQARDTDALWRILSEGRDAISEIPVDRFDWRPLYEAAGDAPRSVSKWLGVLPGIDEFDPLFFDMSPREAETTDPRQRLLLQEAWHALEDAGYGETGLRNDRIGVFVGVEQGEYQFLVGPRGTLTGNHDAILASRLSYALDLQGPALAINTSCSSGLVAAHQACLSLRAGECDAAIAAAVNLVLTPHVYIGMSGAGMLSETGRCHVFDDRANGMVPGEAVVALVLKRLSRANADRDPIHAVVAGSGINYDGRTNGITAPNGAAQARLIRETCAKAAVRPQDIDYVVAHGTATRLGDPVEVGALDQVFRTDEKRQYCALTSTKSNLGHTFAASGLVSLVCLILAMKHRTIPASLHCEHPSDYIDWPNSAFYVNRTNRPWPRSEGRPRFGAVSAFGMSGTNAHMVLREPDAPAPAPVATAPLRLLALSATTDSALRQRIEDLLVWLRAESPDADALSAVSHTLLAHRSHFAHRCAIVAEDVEQALSLLEAALNAVRNPSIVRGKVAADFEERPALAKYADGILRSLPGLESERAAYRESLVALADLYVQGYRLDWRVLYPLQPPVRVRLPLYPFSRQRYWCDPQGASSTPPATDGAAMSDRAPDDDDAPASTSVVQAGMQWLAPAWEAVETAQLATDAGSAFAIPSARPLVIGGGVIARDSVSGSYPRAVFAGADAAAEAISATIEPHPDIDHVVWIAPQTPIDADEALIAAQREGVVALFSLIKALLSHGYGSRTLAWTVVTFRALEVDRGAELEPAHAGAHGLIGSMIKEYPQWAARVLDLNSDADWHGCRWAHVPADARAHPWACRHQRWYRQSLVAVRKPPVASVAPALQRGVHVVVGGAGHVGTVWTEHVMRETGSQIVWIGRRPLDDRIQAAIDRLSAFGPAPEYIVADAADAAQMAAAKDEIVRRHGRVDGLVLSSIHLDPRPLEQMDEAHLHAALRAKLDVGIHAVRAFSGEPLRLLLFFSSVISFVRNPLQSGYAAGCAFSDAYARMLRQRFASTGGPSVKVVNWGFWNRQENLELDGFAKMAQMGIGLIESADGMAALDYLLDAPLDQMGVVRTTKPTLIEGMSPKAAYELHPRHAPPDMADLQARVRAAAKSHQARIAQRSDT
jgi:acyl transferase domain-containing protein/aryl carrier-like protein